MDKLSEVLREVVESALAKGAALFDKTLDSSQAILSMSTTFILQIISTILLFILIKKFLWGKITNILETRKKSINESIELRAKAIEEANIINDESQKLIEYTKKDAKSIITSAENQAKIEAQSILDNALEEIEKTKAKEKVELDKLKQELYDGIKNEIIDVAFEIAKKVSFDTVDEKSQKIAIEKVANELNNGE